MSSNGTPATNSDHHKDSDAIAHVNFRVRCERLGHGEDVYLVQEEDSQLRKKIPLYTTSATYPWYNTTSPLTLRLPRSEESKSSSTNSTLDKLRSPSKSSNQKFFRYRYAVYRASVFHRYEEPSDAQDEDEEKPVNVPMEEDKKPQSHACHQVPYRLLANREWYVVNDVLGKTTGPPNIDHNRLEVPRNNTGTATPGHRRAGSSDGALSVANLHSRSSSFGNANSFGKLAAGLPSSGSGTMSPAVAARKKAVGFAPGPPSYHNHSRGNAAASSTSVPLNINDGLVVVSVFLPISLHRDDDGNWSAAWDQEVLLSMQTHLRVTRIGVVKWRGWHGNQGKGGSPEAGVPKEDRHKVEQCLREFNCVPVWIEPSLFGEMYNGFCKGVLWNFMHNVTSVYSQETEAPRRHSEAGFAKPRDNDQFSDLSMDDIERGPIHGGRGREKELWTAYTTVNQRFAEAVVQYFNPGDLVWIHGFHLLILPSYLTRRIPMAKVGIFLHTPFPSSEIFRTLWCRDDLLRGLLNADQVGFHLFEYARHFLTCCRRLLGLNYGMVPDSSGGHSLAVDTNGRNVYVTCVHAGIDTPMLDQIIVHPPTINEVTNTRNQFAGKTIFCSIDRLESIKGIPLKLLAIERFLKLYPEYVGKIVMIQIGISAFERGDDYRQTRSEVTELANRINGAWPGTVQFRECAESKMRLAQRVALMRAADVAVVTPVRDGLNLIPLEFTVAHQDAISQQGRTDGRKRGLVILSEFASCTRVMRGALHVNPWKISQIVTAIHQALNMSEEERLLRISTAREFVTRVTTQKWAMAIMLDLKGIQKSTNAVQYGLTGMGIRYRLTGMDDPLDFRMAAKAFKNAAARLILVDYGGTIASNDNTDNLRRFKMVKERKSHSEPSPEMLETLKELCSDTKNSVFVVSGKERHSLTKVFGEIPNLGLAAEHGMYISWPTSRTSHRRHWETLVPITDRSWRPITTNIMQVYTSRTHGSYIEETEMKVLWQYRDADLEFGYLQARELEDHLSNCLRGYPVDILHGGMEEGGYVEVRPIGVNKGVLAMKVIQSFPALGQTEKVDFALVLGDDHCDEPMLSVMRQIGRRVQDAKRARNGEEALPELPSNVTMVDVSGCDDFVSPNLEVFTCTVGQKPSEAANYLRDVEEAQELLDALVKVSARDGKYFSASDLRMHIQAAERRSSLPMNPAVDAGTPVGMSKSVSWNHMHRQGSSGEIEETTPAVSSNLVEYLGFDADGEEDEPLGF